MRNSFFISRKITRCSAWVLLAASLAVLAGCGGGSPGSGGGTAGSGGTSGGGSAGAGTGPTLSMALTDSTGAVSSALTLGASLTVQATLKNAAGAAMPNTVISFTSSDTTLGTVTPASGLTNASGIAFSRLDAAGISAQGAGLVNATATFPAGSTSSSTSTPVQASAPFAVGAAAVNLAVSVSQPNISAYGTSSVSATVTVNGAPPANPMTVQFTSGCASSIPPTATLPASISTINGVATATYTDKGCAQADTVVVSVGSTQKTATITVAAPQAANIQFTSATPGSLLVIKGTGGVGYSETAVVQFKVVDASGTGVSGKTVNFGLTTSAGGITLDGIDLSGGGTIPKQTDAAGNVSVTVQAGTLPTAVWVTATLGALSTQSNKLVISTGRPTQDFFSLAASTFNIDGGNYDGATTTLTVHASDRLGNIVADGTSINFVAEGAQIVGQSSGGTTSSTCSTATGTCTVKLVSAAYRPNPDSEPSGLATANRVTVLAYTLGEESFVDLNGNNKWDPGETWDDLGNAFVDANENKSWDATEQFIQYNALNTSACPALPASGKLDAAASKPNSCDGVWGQAHVRQSIVIVLSGDVATIDPSFTTLSMGGTCTKSFVFILKDLYGNPMPAGTAMSVPAADLAVTDAGAPPVPPATTGGTPIPSSVTVSPDSVPNTNAPGGTFHKITVNTGSGKCTTPVSGHFNLKVSTPSATSNNSTFILFTVTP